MRRIIIILIISFFIISCGEKKNLYHNRDFRYKIEYPDTWIALNSGHNPRVEEDFKIRLKKEGIISNYILVDVAFYNPDSSPPIFEFITIRSEQSRFTVKNLKEQMPYLTDLFSLELAKTFYNVRNIRAEMQNFKKGKLFRFDFIFEYDGIDYLASYFIIPGQLFATYFFNSICRVENENEFSISLNNVLKSFHKY